MRSAGSAAWALLALVAGGCAGGANEYVIDVKRTVQDDNGLRWDATAEERFGMRPMSKPSSTTEVSQQSSGPFDWTAPSGWTQVAPTMMRVVNFMAGEHQEVQCYVTILAGDGGGALSNVNRWQDQLGLPDLTPEQFDRLERHPVLGTDGVLLEARNDSDFMYGMVCELPGQAVFVKMTGPLHEMSGERDKFLAFCTSLKEKG
ncbi:MAG: hypothetical protein AAF682_03045 [Planctomycetota bacterium]